MFYLLDPICSHI